MNRRTFIVATALALAPPIADPRAGKKVYRIGYLTPGVPPAAGIRTANLGAFRDGLRALGWVEGEDVAIDVRWSGETHDRLSALAADLAALNVDVIVTISTSAAIAAKQATSTIPIVMAGASNPVEHGLIQSLARPGGNVTGVTNNPGAGFPSKSLALLTQAAATMTRVAVLWDPTNRGEAGLLQGLESAAQGMGVDVVSAEARAQDNFARAFHTIVRKRADGMLVTASSLNLSHRTQIVAFTREHRLPSMFGDKDFVAAGGLMSYWTNWLALRRQAARYVDRILKGAKPGDLPVEQPTKFELVINRKTAKEFGIAIPPSLLLLADEVIY